MRIDKELCVCCGECIALCPVNAIRLQKKDKTTGAKAHAEIDYDECVECAACFRSKICPENAIQEEKLVWPRILRKAFSDPVYTHKGTDIPGRGTEEMKTNDVTGRFRRGEYGMALEFGRPGTGARLADLEKVLLALVGMDVELEHDNAVFALLEEPFTGRMKPEFRNEKVLSAILEFKIREEQLEAIVRQLRPVLEDLDTVVSWGLATRFAEDGTLPVRERLKILGLPARPNAKINMGMGRPIVEP
jgi:NAD-dependent dihydropyrimidine dehydrogenase PreA subunit